MKTEGYRVKEGQKVKLKDWDTDDHAGLEEHDAKILTKELEDGLFDWQERLYAEKKQSLLIVLQARDAGGKDGVVKKVVSSFNPNGLKISGFKVPTDDERAHDFLWRIHAQTPAQGMIGVFNRSHYEDVLVTRVYGMIDKKTAKARLKQIQHFEELLSSAGTRILKFYLHISPDEQKQRLQDRLDEADKNWKFNPGDLRDREHWSQFTAAYQDVLATSTVEAPWYVIPANNKWFRDLLISQILLDTLKDMNPQFPQVDFNPADIRIK